jgi:dinuclear metal center YbgI/SA1388 family protein
LSGATVLDAFRALDARWPFAHRSDWDNVGILLGDPRREVRKVLVSLDATPASVSRCIRSGASLLVTHHPPIFSPMKDFREDRAPASLLFPLVRAGAAVISAHTNADLAADGVSHAAARRLGLRSLRPLLPGETAGARKVVVFVPPSHEGAVLDSMTAAGAGRIGAYSRCAFRSAGTGSYLPGAGSAPFRGKAGQEERVEERRLEAVVAGADLGRVLAAIREVHPYEEPAVDVYPLSGGSPLGGGLGVVGELPEPLPVAEALKLVRTALRAATLRAAGPRSGRVRRVAVVGGSGGGMIGAAAAAGADLYVTGDVKHHEALEAAAGPMVVADAGHAATEKWILPEFASALRKALGSAVRVNVHEEEEPLRDVPGGNDGGRGN